ANPPVPLLPFLDARPGKLVIGIIRTIGPHIQHHGGSKKLLHRNLVDGRFSRLEVHRSIQMRPVMLERPEASCEVSIFLDRSVYLRFKHFFVARPRSEERRVGKECRSGESSYHIKKKR